VPLPGAAAIADRMDWFATDLPAISAYTDRRDDELTFVEFADAVSMWLEAELKRIG
jgi:hypothetical protein